MWSVRDAPDAIVIAMPTFSSCARCSRLLEEAHDAPASARRPCPVCGSLRRVTTASLGGASPELGQLEPQAISSDTVAADASNEASLLRALFRARLEWFAIPDGRMLVRVLNGNGAILDGGLGRTAEIALAEVVRRLVPPVSAA
jgi:hypothetical protein